MIWLVICYQEVSDLYGVYKKESQGTSVWEEEEEGRDGESLVILIHQCSRTECSGSRNPLLILELNGKSPPESGGSFLQHLAFITRDAAIYCDLEFHMR